MSDHLSGKVSHRRHIASSELPRQRNPVDVRGIARKNIREHHAIYKLQCAVAGAYMIDQASRLMKLSEVAG
jgi:hypothetical protein